MDLHMWGREGGIGFVTSEAAINHTGNPFRRNISHAKSASRKIQLSFSPVRLCFLTSESSVNVEGGIHPIHFGTKPSGPRSRVVRLACLLLHLYVRGVSDDAVNPHGNQTDNAV